MSTLDYNVTGRPSIRRDTGKAGASPCRRAKGQEAKPKQKPDQLAELLRPKLFESTELRNLMDNTLPHNRRTIPPPYDQAAWLLGCLALLPKVHRQPISWSSVGLATDALNKSS